MRGNGQDCAEAGCPTLTEARRKLASSLCGMSVQPSVTHENEILLLKRRAPSTDNVGVSYRRALAGPIRRRESDGGGDARPFSQANDALDCRRLRKAGSACGAASQHKNTER